MRTGRKAVWRTRILAPVLLLAMSSWAWAATPQTLASTPLERAQQLVEWGRFKEARTLLQSASTDSGNSTNAALLAYFGHVEVMFGKLKAARELTKKAVKLDKSCASCHLYRFEAMARHAQTMNQFRALLALHGIKKQLEQAEKLNPNLGDVQWGWIRLDLSIPSSLGGGSGDALKHAAILSRLDPVDGHLARAAIFESENKPKLAMAEYRADAREHPGDPEATFALGKALYQHADYAGAAGPLHQAWNAAHASAFYGAYHAANLVRLQRPDQARTVLEAAQQEHPNSRLGDFLTAQALIATGQDTGWAKHLLQRYLAVPPEPQQATAAEARKLLASLNQHPG